MQVHEGDQFTPTIFCLGQTSEECRGGCLHTDTVYFVSIHGIQIAYMCFVGMESSCLIR